MDNINSEEFVKRLKARDPLAFQELVETLLPKLVGYLSHRFYEVEPEDLEEIASDVLLKVHESVVRFEPGKAKLTTWIFTIAINAAIDHVRRLGVLAKKAEFVRPRFLKNDDPDKEVDAFEEFAKNTWKAKEREIAAVEDGSSPPIDVEVDAMARALDSLDARDQTVLRLRLIDMDYEQIAEIEGEKNPATLRVRHKRAMEKLEAAYLQGVHK